MFEMLIKPKHAERKPHQLFFIGLIYATLSMLLVNFVFINDSILMEGAGLLLVLFTVMFCMPFVYFIIKLEEGKDIEISNSGKLIKEHWKAIKALVWLFLGIVVSFSFWYVFIPHTFNKISFTILGFMPLIFYLLTSKNKSIRKSLKIVFASFGILFILWGMLSIIGSSPLLIEGNSGTNFNFQIKTFCAINNPSSMNNYNNCLNQYGLITGAAIIPNSWIHFGNIFMNNLQVTIFTILFSLIFGAGAIFILVWNASVIAAAIGMFAKGGIINLPCAYLRYFIHGIPEITAYFLAALSGGIISVAIIRKDLRDERLWLILQDAMILLIIALIILFFAGLIEVYLTQDIVRFFGCAS